jgi:hypothetical protein
MVRVSGEVLWRTQDFGAAVCASGKVTWRKETVARRLAATARIVHRWCAQNLSRSNLSRTSSLGFDRAGEPSDQPLD